MSSPSAYRTSQPSYGIAAVARERGAEMGVARVVGWMGVI